jgi:hypothetical protein
MRFLTAGRGSGGATWTEPMEADRRRRPLFRGEDRSGLVRGCLPEAPIIRSLLMRLLPQGRHPLLDDNRLEFLVWLIMTILVKQK